MCMKLVSLAGHQRQYEFIFVHNEYSKKKKKNQQNNKGLKLHSLNWLY